jgi:membrane-associated protein
VNSAVLALGPALALGPSWLDPQTMLNGFGSWALWGAAAVIFAECGLLLGFFLPGDSLLFTVGLLVGGGVINQPLWLACLVLTVAAFSGNACGYEIGRVTGPRIFSRPDSRLFKREYVDKTVGFFDKYGARAIVLARFVPIVRTFITVTAGVGKMDRRRYLTYSGIGGLLWASGVTVLGQLLGQVEFVAKNLELMLIAIVFVSVVPILIEYLRHRRSSGQESGPESSDRTGSGPESFPGSFPGSGQGAGPGVSDRSSSLGRAATPRHAIDPGGGPWTSSHGIPAVQDPADG